MLVISRNVGEEVVIDGHIVVCVVDVRHGKVRLGIKAPKEIPVHRREIQDRVDAGESWGGPND